MCVGVGVGVMVAIWPFLKQFARKNDLAIWPFLKIE